MIACFTGHRKIKGVYDIHSETWKPIVNQLKEVIKDLVDLGVTKFITGGALGVDTLAFCLVHNYKIDNPEKGIQNILAVPYEGHYKRWNAQSIQLFFKLEECADVRVEVNKLDLYKSNDPIRGLHLRNQYMVDNSDFVVAVWDGTESGGTYNCMCYAKNNHKVIVHVPVYE